MLENHRVQKPKGIVVMSKCLINLFVLVVLSSCTSNDAATKEVIDTELLWRNTIHDIVEKKIGLLVEFPVMHGEVVTQIPDKSPIHIEKELLKQGFVLVQSGRGNHHRGPRVVSKLLKKDNCYCDVNKWYYNTTTKKEYMTTESIVC